MGLPPPPLLKNWHMTNVIRVIIIEEKQQNVDLPFDTTECWSERPALNTNYKSLTNDIKQTVIRKLSHSVQTQKLHKLQNVPLVGKDDAGKSAGSPTKGQVRRWIMNKFCTIAMVCKEDRI